MRASQVACEGLDLLHASLQCSQDAWSQALMLDRRNGYFGCTEAAGGGGGDVSLLRLDGGVWWTSGCWVSVSGRSNWVVEAWFRSLQVCGFLDRRKGQLFVVLGLKCGEGEG